MCTKTRRIARFDLSPEIFKDLMGMPKSSEIFGVDWSFERNCMTVYVADPILAEVPEGSVVPKVTPTVTVKEWDYCQDKG